MQRYHNEKHVIAHRAKLRKQINSSMDTWFKSLPSARIKPAHEVEDGQLRKTLRCGGCTRARCQVCHPEKYPKRIPTRQELQSQKDFKNYDFNNAD
jgi:hypothetical protein